VRKVILLMHLSLDGFTAGPDGALDWIVVDNEIWKEIIDLQNTADTALFGRVNYQGFESYWPTVPSDPNASTNEREHAHWLEQASKLVFSATLSEVNWKNTRIAKEPVAKEIATLKQQAGKNLLVFGGASLAQTCVKENLIDEYRLLINPVVLGQGSPLFQDIQQRIALKLLESRTYRSGVVELRYQTAQQ
jgi:dihydrofolate reductase